ncbi:hypothetical protein L7F22_016569 [Adiantum nelumboides]|nr:hypothetical protein [Adiantum nelumboides]
MTFQKHPLLVSTSVKKRLSPTSADASLSSSLSRSLMLNGEEQLSSSNTVSGFNVAKPRRSSVSPARPIVNNERTYSPASFEDEEKEDDQDADSVEASLRFPIFARRSLMFEGGSEKRKHSPVRSPMTLIELSNNGSQNTSHDSELIGKETESTDFSSNAEDMDEEEVLFSLDDEIQTNNLSGQGYDKEAQYDLHEGEEAIDIGGEDEEPSSLPLSLAYSTSSHSIRRQSDHSSADLDMIWDEEEDEGLTSAIDSRTTLDDLEESLRSNTSKVSSHNSVKSKPASPRKEFPIAIIGGFDREGNSVGMDHGEKSPSADTSLFRRSSVRMPLIQRSSSASRYSNGDQSSNGTRRLSFARRQGDYNVSPQYASPSSNSLHSNRRNTCSCNSPTKLMLSRRENDKQVDSQIKIASQPNLLAVDQQSPLPSSTEVETVANIMVVVSLCHYQRHLLLRLHKEKQ